MRIQYTVCMLAAFLLASCSDPKEEGNDEYRLSYGKVDINISMTLPQPKLVKASTRAVIADTDIKNVDVLVFDKDANFMERIKVESGQLTDKGNEITFTVKLNSTQEKRTIHLVANGRTSDGVTDRLNFNVLNEGMPESTAFSSLKTAALKSLDANAEENSQHGVLQVGCPAPLVMWGRFVLDNGINAGKTVNGVKLLRAAACIQVRVGDATPDNGLADFSVDYISIYHGAICGFLAPADYAGMAGDTPTAANPIPGTEACGYLDGMYYGDLSTTAPYSSTTATGGTEPATLNSFYVYERNCTPEDYMAILIQANYKGVAGWYKVVMLTVNGVPLDIIRNHRYIITIIGVNSYGHKQKIEAVNSPPTNALRVELTDEHTDYPFIAASGEYILGLSNNAYIGYGCNEFFATSEPYVSGAELCHIIHNSSDRDAVMSIEGGYAASFIPPRAGTYAMFLGCWGYNSCSYYIFSADFLSKKDSPESFNATVFIHNVSLPLRVTWNKKISPPFYEDSDSYVLDLIEPADKNWNIRILNPPSTNKLALHPSAGSPAAYPGSGMVTELNSKYNSHAYLHVAKESVRYKAMGTVLKTSVIDGKPVVTRIEIFQ